MDALFREFGIYAAQGQKYEPVDHNLLLSYTESPGRPDPRGGHHRGRLPGQLHRRRHLLRHPRRADGAVLHLLFDVRLPAGRRPHLGRRRRPGPGLPARRHRRAHHAARRGPAAPGRPQPGAGLDRARPVAAYDPAFAYEMAHHHPRRHRRACTAPSEDVFYYLTLYNENYPMPPTPGRRGRRHPRAACTAGPPRLTWATTPPATILFSGSAHGAAREAQDELAEHYGVGAELWSATSYKALREDALAVERWNRLHPGRAPHPRRHRAARRGRRGRSSPSPTSCGPCPTRSSRWVPRRLPSLGTDGFGRSDTREALRRFFEIDTGHVVVATLTASARPARSSRPRSRRRWSATTSTPTAPSPGTADRDRLGGATDRLSADAPRYRRERSDRRP